MEKEMTSVSIPASLYKKIEEKIKHNAEMNWQSPTGNRLVRAKLILNHLETQISG